MITYDARWSLPRGRAPDPSRFRATSGFLDDWVTEPGPGTFALPRGVPGGIYLDLATAGDLDRIAQQECARAGYGEALKWYTRTVRLLGLWIAFAVEDRLGPTVRRLPGMAGRSDGLVPRVRGGEDPTARRLLAAAYYNRATIRHELGDYEGALSDYTCALTAGNPKPWVVRRNRALVYEKLGRGQEALHDLVTALREIPAAGGYKDRRVIERILARVAHANGLPPTRHEVA